jgi:hypothetical protein
MPLGRAAAASLLLLLAACIMDGKYIVRGTVMGESGTVAVPVVGATVVVGHADGKTGNGTARTSADGSYTTSYSFGGMFPFVSGARPAVEFAAAGYRTCRLDLQSSTTPPEVTRRPCDPPEKGCFVLDVVLVSEESSPPRP